MSIEVELSNVSKRFKRDWVIQQLSTVFQPGSRTAILGQNGSGKSTLLKIITGFVSTTEGEVQWKKDGQLVEPSDWHHFFSYSAPYLELIEEYTLQECLDFHLSLKQLRQDIELDAILEASGLQHHKHKQVQNFSSGMKQRLKLILAICSEVPCYFLDEPCSNLDLDGIEWYKKLVLELPQDKTIVVASNNEYEYEFCTGFISNFKREVS